MAAHIFVAVLVGFIPAVSILQGLGKGCGCAGKGVVIQRLRAFYGNAGEGIRRTGDNDPKALDIDGGLVIVQVEIGNPIQSVGGALLSHFLDLIRRVMGGGNLAVFGGQPRLKAVGGQGVPHLAAGQLPLGGTVLRRILQEAGKVVIYSLRDIAAKMGVLPAHGGSPGRILIGPELLPDLFHGHHVIGTQLLRVKILVHRVGHGLQLAGGQREPGPQLLLPLHQVPGLLGELNQAAVRQLQVLFDGVVDPLCAHDSPQIHGQVIQGNVRAGQPIQLLHHLGGLLDIMLHNVAPELWKRLLRLGGGLLQGHFRVLPANALNGALLVLLPRRGIRQKLGHTLLIRLRIDFLILLDGGKEKALEPRLRPRHISGGGIGGGVVGQGLPHPGGDLPALGPLRLGEPACAGGAGEGVVKEGIEYVQVGEGAGYGGGIALRLGTNLGGIRVSVGPGNVVI